MNTSKRGQVSRCKLLLILLVWSVCVASAADPTNSTTALTVRSRSETQIKGWTPVSDKWPTSKPDYFVAVDKGHHFIQVKLPNRLLGDLSVKLAYYYSHAKVRPFFQIVPCNTNVDILSNDGQTGGLPLPGIWHTHTMRIKRSDCERRKELAYNVLLHDANDVFAWSLLEIKSAEPEVAPVTEAPITVAPTVGPQTLKPAIPEPLTTGLPEAQDLDDPSQPIDPIYGPVMEEPKPSPQVDQGKKDDAENQPEKPLDEENAPESEKLTEREPKEQSDREKQTEGDKQQEGQEEPKEQSGQEKHAEGDKRPESGAQEEQVEPKEQSGQGKHTEGDKQQERQVESEKSPLPEEESKPNESPKSDSSEKETQSGDDSKDQSPKDEEAKDDLQSRRAKNAPKRKQTKAISNGWNRVERDTKQALDEAAPNQAGLIRRTRATPEKLNLVCKPSLCDKSLVVIDPRFMRVIGASALHDKPSSSAESTANSLTYLNTNNQPLTIQIDSDERDLADIDPCLDFHLYLDQGTSLALMLEEDQKSSGGKQKLLESFEGVPAGSNSDWKRIHRCISDYMPKLKTSTQQKQQQKPGGKVAHQDDEKAIHRLKLSMVPQSPAPDRRKIMINLSRDRMISLKNKPLLLDFLPNALNQVNAKSIERFWVLDHDGTKRAEFEFVQANNSGAANSSSGKKVLQVDKIDPKQEYFDLTSRWLKIKDLEVLDHPVLFNYHADKAPWIKALDFEFQNADNPAGQWRSNRIYDRKSNPAESGRVNYQQRTNGSSLETTGVQEKVDEDEAITAPIRLRGLTDQEFRVRLRHHVDETLAARSQSHQLTIRKLAFGDVCAFDRPFCLNGGRCTPTGVSQAKCSCLRGFSGKNCEISRPCDVIYSGGLIGSDFCKSVGAKCVENIPVFKCIWPDDRYYQCKSLIPSRGTPGTPEESTGEPAQSDSERVKELEAAANDQKQLLIVMGVFMAALMLFAVVIVINMIAKLRKSNKRLKTAKIEVHELTRQSTPGTSSSAAGASSFGRPNSRNKPAAVLAYNNRAFDAAGL